MRSLLHTSDDWDESVTYRQSVYRTPPALQHSPYPATFLITSGVQYPPTPRLPCIPLPGDPLFPEADVFVAPPENGLGVVRRSTLLIDTDQIGLLDAPQNWFPATPNSKPQPLARRGKNKLKHEVPTLGNVENTSSGFLQVPGIDDPRGNSPVPQEPLPLPVGQDIPKITVTTHGKDEENRPRSASDANPPPVPPKDSPPQGRRPHHRSRTSTSDTSDTAENVLKPAGYQQSKDLADGRRTVFRKNHTLRPALKPSGRKSASVSGDEALSEVLDDLLLSLAEYRIPPHRLDFGSNRSPFARGGFGEVRKATLTGRGGAGSKTVAVKSPLSSESRAFVRTVVRFAREVMVWVQLRHPNVIPFLGFFVDHIKKDAYFVCLYAPNGNIKEFLEREPQDIIEKLELVNDVSRGLEYLHHHSPQICHGDLKAANVLIGHNGRAMLCDFGLALVTEEGFHSQLTTDSSEFKGSYRWCSPEVLDGKPRTTASDMWAWGLLVIEIITGRIPHETKNTMTAIILQIVKGVGATLTDFPEFTDLPALWDILCRCWKTDPKDRLRIKDCFKGIVSARAQALKAFVPENVIGLSFLREHAVSRPLAYETNLSSSTVARTGNERVFAGCFVSPSRCLYAMVYKRITPSGDPEMAISIHDTNGPRWIIDPTRSEYPVPWLKTSYLDVAFDDLDKLVAVGNDRHEYKTFGTSDNDSQRRAKLTFPMDTSLTVKSRSHFCETDLLVYGGPVVLCGTAVHTKSPTNSIVLDLMAYGTPGKIENVFISASRQFFAVTWTPDVQADGVFLGRERLCRVWMIRSRAPFELGEELVWLEHVSHSVVLGFSGDLLITMTKTQRIILINLAEESIRFYRLPVHFSPSIDALIEYQRRGATLLGNWLVIPEKLSDCTRSWRLHFCELGWNSASNARRKAGDETKSGNYLQVIFEWTLTAYQAIETMDVRAGIITTRQAYSPRRVDQIEIWTFDPNPGMDGSDTSSDTTEGNNHAGPTRKEGGL